MTKTSYILYDQVVHTQSPEGYEDALIDALRSISVQNGVGHTVNVILFGMKCDEGKFTLSLQVIVDDSSGEWDSTQFNLHPRSYPGPNEEIEADIEQREFASKAPETSLVLGAFNRRGIVHRLEPNSDKTHEILPGTSLYLDVKTLIDSNLRFGQQDDNHHPGEDFIAAQGEENSFDARKASARKNVRLSFYGAELNIRPEERHIAENLEPIEMRYAVEAAAKAKLQAAGIALHRNEYNFGAHLTEDEIRDALQKASENKMRLQGQRLQSERLEERQNLQKTENLQNLDIRRRRQHHMMMRLRDLRFKQQQKRRLLRNQLIERQRAGVRRQDIVKSNALFYEELDRILKQAHQKTLLQTGLDQRAYGLPPALARLRNLSIVEVTTALQESALAKMIYSSETDMGALETAAIIEEEDILDFPMMAPSSWHRQLEAALGTAYQAREIGVSGPHAIGNLTVQDAHVALEEASLTKETLYPGMPSDSAIETSLLVQEGVDVFEGEEKEPRLQKDETTTDYRHEEEVSYAEAGSTLDSAIQASVWTSFRKRYEKDELASDQGLVLAHEASGPEESVREDLKNKSADTPINQEPLISYGVSGKALKPDQEEISAQDAFVIHPDYQELRIYIEDMGDVSQFIPKQSLLGLRLYEHLQQESMRAELERNLEGDLKEALKNMPGITARLDLDDVA